VLVLLLAPAAGAQVELVPRVGFDFEHFGETYRLTEDQDTVTTINDYGTVVGLTARTPWSAGSRFRLDTDVHLGKETHRFRLDFEGRLLRGANALEVEQQGSYRLFRDDGDFSLSSNTLQEYLRLGWERRLGERTRVRLRETLDLTWYEDPDEYNLTTFLHRPGVDLRRDVGELGELRLGYQLGRRSVPDSTLLEYWRHTWDADLSLLFGWTGALDVATQLDRRDYDPGSLRESSWEYRGDVRFEFGAGERATFRLVHESELIRYDHPDELDFDSNWTRTGFQVEMHRTTRLDLSVMPVYAFLTSDVAPEEEYSETGLEFGVDWRVGSATWINVTDEVGRREYEISAVETEAVDLEDPTGTGVTSDPLLDTAFSDYLYNRLTVLVTSDIARTVSVNLFANWQPEDHRVNRHDTDTRIVSGGVEYRF